MIIVTPYDVKSYPNATHCKKMQGKFWDYPAVLIKSLRDLIRRPFGQILLLQNLGLYLLLVNNVLRADTILLKDGQELKGVVVEDYHDRVIFSTEKGEVCISKGKIERIGYDIPEENLVRLGALYRDKGDYTLALYCYEMACKLNPNIKEAQEGLSLVSNMLLRKRELDLEKEVALRQDTEEKMGRSSGSETATTAWLAAKIDELWNRVGISIENVGPNVKVSKVLKGSGAEEAGLKEGDTIVSVWGRLICYTPLRDVYELFLRNSVSEVRIAVLRGKNITLRRNHIFGGAEGMIGGRLTVEFEGLTVSEVKPGGPLEDADVANGDRVTQLAGASTRYMPLASAYKLIEEIKGDLLGLEIQREIIFWKD